MKKQKIKLETRKTSSGSEFGAPTNSNFNTNNNNRSSNNKKDRKPSTVSSPFETCGEANHSRCYFGANAANKLSRLNVRQSQVQQTDAQNNKLRVSRLQPNL